MSGNSQLGGGRQLVNSQCSFSAQAECPSGVQWGLRSPKVDRLDLLEPQFPYLLVGALDRFDFWVPLSFTFCDSS